MEAAFRVVLPLFLSYYRRKGFDAFHFKEVAVSRKLFTQVFVLVTFLLALLATPLSARAGGVCGGMWTVAKGETLDSIAAMCGTTVTAITAANPGMSGALTVGQVITVPGSTNTTPST